MAVVHTWTGDTSNLFSAFRWDSLNRAWLYLVAEAIPDGRWDWAVWSDDDSGRLRAGVTSDRAEALEQAQQAAASFSRIRVLAVA